MKQFIKYFFAVGLVTGLAAGCEKKEDLPFYAPGDTPTMGSNVGGIAAEPKDSLSEILTLSWSNPKFASDSASAKYIVEIDSAGRNFSHANRRTVTGSLITKYTAKELNQMMIGWGFLSGKSYNIEARVTASYANNNDQKTSNTITLTAVPYKVPPKIPVPGELVIVGGATNGGWDNPPGGSTTSAAALAQKFWLQDETTYVGIFWLKGGEQYLMLPKSGEWSHKYGGTSKTGGDLLVDGDVPGSNTPAPDADGFYKITVDFQTGKYTVTPYSQANGLPDQLVAVGGATPGGWSNDAGNPQKFSRLNSVEFTIDLDLVKEQAYLLLPVPGSWDKKFGVDDNSLESAKMGGNLVPQGKDIPSPLESAKYRIYVNFATGTYKLTKL